MNNERRKRIKDACDKIWEAINILTEVKEEEEEAYDNLPDGLQYSERGEQMSDNVYALEDAVSTLEDLETTLEDLLEGIRA